MKKTYLARRNALLSSRSFSWGASTLAIVILILLVRLIAPDLFWKIFAPVFRSSDAIAKASYALSTGFSDTVALARSNQALADDNAALVAENQALVAKVANLSALLGTTQKGVSGILAGVVARPPESPYDTLTLAAGKDDGVVLGMEAFGAGGAPIGVVSAVLDTFSRVTLFSASGVTTSGWVGRAAAPLIITGSGGGTMLATISRSASVAVGDTVFVPGPGMLPVGTVVRIDSNPLSPGETLRIRPAVNIFSIGEVELRVTGVTPSVFATSTP